MSSGPDFWFPPWGMICPFESKIPTAVTPGIWKNVELLSFPIVIDSELD